jgi:hypothetical protein
MAKKVGRPSRYTKEIADLICERLASHSAGLKKLCTMFDDMPSHTVGNSQFYLTC